MSIDAYGTDGASYQHIASAQQMYANGIHFAMWKATEGTGYENPNFATSMNAMHAAGIRCGAYHFAHTDPAGEADTFKAAAGGWLGPGNLWPMLDMEASDARAGANDFICRFYDRLGTGCLLVYGNQDWWTNVFTPSAWGNRNILGHIASYTGTPGQPAWTYPKMAVHQHTSQGNIPGDPGLVDRDCTMPGFTLDQITIGGTDMPLSQADADLVADTLLNRPLGSPGYWSQQKVGAILITLWTAVYGDASATPSLAPGGILGRLNTLTREIPSTVEGSTYKADGAQYAANSDGYGYNAAATLDEIKTAVAAFTTPSVDTAALASQLAPLLNQQATTLTDTELSAIAKAVNDEMARREAA